MFIIMYTNSYNSIPVMAQLKKQKNKSNNQKKIKEFDSFDYLIFNLPSPRNPPSSQPSSNDPFLNEAPKLIKINQK